MDTHGLTWTNTFIHAQSDMNKTSDTDYIRYWAAWGIYQA